jgi:hypothetical protein
MRTLIRIIPLSILCLHLAGCSQQVDSTDNNLYPMLPAGTEISTMSLVETSILPTPNQETGVVVGYLISRITNSPLVAQTVYLGEFLPMEPGSNYLVTLEVEGSPHTKTDDQGRFVFAEIAPGDYPLIVWTPFRSKVVTMSPDERALAVTVRAGESLDLGQVEVEWP